jgi:cation diffusion facilitator family transporter
MAAESKKAIVAAVIGNAAIAAIKFVAATVTGSSAMISEGIHSLVDTGNGILLYHGLRRGARPPDAQHAFGHGMELYFWSLIVAISIFALGGGMSIYEGITHLLHPSPLESPYVNYIVLGLSVVFESISFAVAWRAFRAHKGSKSSLTAVRHGKDPSLFTVLFEDTAALLGLVAAFFGVLLSDLFDMPRLDGAASIVIGLILVSAAVWLAAESRSLLVGEAADPELVEAVRQIALTDPAVVGLGSVLTMHLGPDQILLNIEVEFRPHISVEQVDAAVRRIESHIRGPYPRVSRIFIEVHRPQDQLIWNSRSTPDCAGGDLSW